MATTFHRLVRDTFMRWILVLMSISTLVWGCARAPEIDHPYLPNLVSSDWLNFTITYDMTRDETTRDAIEFKYSNDGFPIVKDRKRAETMSVYAAVGWWQTISMARAKQWRFQVFDQTGTRICPKDPPEWKEVNSSGEETLSCGPVLKDNKGNVNDYVTLELDYVLSGDPNEKGNNHFTLGHVLRLIPASRSVAS